MPAEHSEPSGDLSSYGRSFWNLLGDLVFEDSYSLAEVILALDPVLRGIPEEEAHALSAQVVRELLEREWIYLFRLQGLSPNDAFKRPDLRLPLEEAYEQVSRMLESRDTSVDIWMAPTEIGTAAAMDPPPNVRSLWGWKARA
jgi:hypothetical protein